jgi:NitT/TauT family transport system substrate-binding protein
MLRTASPGRVHVLSAVVGVSAGFLLGGCSTMSPERPQAPELQTLRVAVTKTIDTVPLRLAVERGMFRRAGLDLQLVEQGSQAGVLSALRSGDVDLGVACNMTLLTAASDGAQFELQGEAYISGRNTMALVTLPGKGYAEPTDEPAPVIGLEPGRELGRLATRSRLATEGVDADRIEFKPLKFDEMIPALQSGAIDAAWMTEPQISSAQKEHGARIVTDTALGALLEFPVSSYAAMKNKAKANPRTFALFRQTLARAQQLAEDRAAVRAELAELTSLDKTTVELVSLGSYPTSLNGVRLQRVADLMHRSGVVPGRIDVAALLPAIKDG